MKIVEFISLFITRIALLAAGSFLFSIFYNNTIAWNFNLPNIAMYEFFIGALGLYCFSAGMSTYHPNR